METNAYMTNNLLHSNICNTIAKLSSYSACRKWSTKDRRYMETNAYMTNNLLHSNICNTIAKLFFETPCILATESVS
jgi:hypothetical protein